MNQKSLIVVESPSKARTIEKYLDGKYEVIACVGHVKDLPSNKLGIDIENNFEPEYVVPPEKKKVISELKKAVKEAETVWLASDEDREGEAISWHLKEALKLPDKKTRRIVFHEITKTAILNALKNPRDVDQNLVDAQQARRILDRVVGYKLTPLLASKIQKGLSGGRVQRSTLKLVVDREREIKAFKPVEYWSIDTVFKKDIDATLITHMGDKLSKLSIQNKKEAEAIEKSVKADTFTIAKIETKQRKSSTPPPFMTSTLQQTATSRLGFTPKKTMMIAQSLYEGVRTPDGTSGVITYMRTDSLNLASEAIGAIRGVLKTDMAKNIFQKNQSFIPKKQKGLKKLTKLSVLLFSKIPRCRTTLTKINSTN